MYRVQAMAYLNFQTDTAPEPVMRKWLFRALILSLCLHAALFVFFRTKKLEHFSVLTDRLVPRAFSVQRLDIDPKLLQKEEDEPPAAAKTPAIKPIDLPEEKPSDEKIPDNSRVTPLAPELTKPIALDKPHVEAANLDAIKDVQKSASREMENDLKTSLNKSLLRDSPKVSTQALLKYSEGSGKSGGDSDAAGMAAASDQLNKLLGRGLRNGDAPLSLPGGALFEFNSAELKLDAITQLRKLGELIKKNPHVLFSIEGHSDSFGDDEANNAISLQRAEAVKNWLVQNADVDPSHIQTQGFGKTRLVVPPSAYDAHSQASIDAEKMRQARNRRVEIVFRFPHAD